MIDCEIYNKVAEQLKKIKDNLIEAPSDISDTVRAVFDLAGTLNDSDISDSSYIHWKVDEFIRVSQAHSKDMINERIQISKDLKAYKKKKDYISRDLEVDEYLNNFMSVIKGGYKTSEVISKGLFQLVTEKGEWKLLHSASSCLDLIPVGGLSLRKGTNKNFITDSLSKMIEANSMIAVVTFHQKEIEMVVEYAIVSFLYKYKDYFR